MTARLTILGPAVAMTLSALTAPSVASADSAATSPASAGSAATSPASANPAATPTRADALFTAAKQLRDAGLYEDACPKFAETEQIDPGVGVMLYLADCYQHTGRSANAWAEFRKAEKLARDRNDKRQDMAKARADALESKLTRMTIGVADPAKHPGLEIAVDGTRILPENWNATLPTDPGAHAVAITEPGQAPRTLNVHLDEGASLTVPAFETASTPPPPTTAPASAPPAATDAPAETASGSPGNVRTYIGFGLLGGGTVALAVGAGLLDLENRSITKGHKSSNAGTFSGVAFAIAGAAYASAVVLYLTAPKDRSTALTLSAVPVASGAGALLQGSF
jgi:serine/threonine-protein kinase